MDYEISPKNPDEFFNTNMFGDLNDKQWPDWEDKMFEREFLNNYTEQILNTKYKQVVPTECN